MVDISAIVARVVCRDFVVYDSEHNSLRDIIPLTHDYPILLQIIIANSAIHMHNATQPFLIQESSDDGQISASLRNTPGNLYSDALAAKQRALTMLRQVLAQQTPKDIDVTLAVVIMFINLELMDAKAADWIHHINGGRKIIEALCKSEQLQITTASPLRRFLVSNWMM